MTSKVTIKHLTISDNDPTHLMAAVNLSQESFYKGSILDFNDKKKFEERISSLIDQGAEIIDLGPKSSAPIDIYGNETAISIKEEIRRITKPLEVFSTLDAEIIISIDTQSSQVAEFALSHGADIINDISGLKNDPLMAKVIGDHNGFLIAMACETKPGDVFTLNTVVKALDNTISLAHEYISRQNIIIDPGIGGWIPKRTPEHDFQLILDTPKLKKQLGCPALIALSRKSFIGKTLSLPPDKRLNGSLAATAISILYGANIIRTHDLKETRESIIIAEKFKKLLS